MIEWKEYTQTYYAGFINGHEFFAIDHALASERPWGLYFFNKYIGTFKSLEAAKAKAEELLTEWLTTAIKDLPEDKLAELGLVMRIPEIIK